MVRRYIIKSATGRSIMALMSCDRVKELARSLADLSRDVHEVLDEDDPSVKFTFVPGVQSPDDLVYHEDHEDDEDQED